MSSNLSGIERVLFDVPGPRTRRRIRSASVVAAVVVIGLVVAAVVQFQVHGQLAASQWKIFGQQSIIRFLADGLWATLRAAAVAAVIALPLAFAAAFARLARSRTARIVGGCYVEFLRAVPVLLLLYVFLLLLPRYGVNVGSFWMLVLPLALSNSAALGEIFRAGVLSMERGQFEAAYAVGLTQPQVMRLVIVPQVVRRLAPALISQAIYLLKGTTLGYVVSYTELLHQAQTIGEYHNIFERINGPLIQSYLVVMAIFVVINASLAKLARVVEGRQLRRYGRSVAAPVTEDVAATDEAVAAGR
jgi:glutamate transport system permease protein